MFCNSSVVTSYWAETRRGSPIDNIAFAKPISLLTGRSHITAGVGRQTFKKTIFLHNQDFSHDNFTQEKRVKRNEMLSSWKKEKNSVKYTSKQVCI